MSLGLAHPVQRLVNTILLPAHHYVDNTAPMTNSAPPCARGSTATPSTPATPTRHRPRRSSHGYLDHGTSPYALGYLNIGTKGYHLLEQLVGFLYSQRVR